MISLILIISYKIDRIITIVYEELKLQRKESKTRHMEKESYIARM